ncbi:MULTISPECIES: hypothetical protein [Streptomyces]|uniref:Uncharacterized protein n=1 Tax=Streptomyces sp. 900129855 TaxID=3155129 RepID=A0ABV2ZQ51_9ACTN
MTGSFDDELAAFAQELSDLHIACGRPGLTEIVRRADSFELTRSGVSEALTGMRLPKREFLIALVRVLVAHGDGKETRQISLDDPRLTLWSDEWTRLSRLQRQTQPQPHPQSYSKPKPKPKPKLQPQAHRVPSRLPVDFELPAQDAPRHELEGAKEGLRTIIADIEVLEEQTREEFRERLGERSKVKAGIRDLEALLAKERNDNAELKQQLADLEQQRDMLDGQVVALRQQLHDMTAEKLDLVNEEKEILTWQYRSNYEWGRFEERARERAEAELEAVRTALTREIAELTDALADSARKLEAADLLIRDLRNH